MITFRDELFGSLALDEKNMHACMHAGRVACLGCVCWHIHIYIYIFIYMYICPERDSTERYILSCIRKMCDTVGDGNGLIIRHT